LDNNTVFKRDFKSFALKALHRALLLE